MSRFAATPLPLTGLTVVKRHINGDHRGFLSRLFCADELAEYGWQHAIAQINHTFTAKTGTIRGMHFQRHPHAEMKMISCLQGSIWDVAVDIRPNSPTFLQWHGELLSAENHHSLIIPEGFAHGFQTLSDNVELIYVHSHRYQSDAEGGIRPLDPTLAIDWPLPPTTLSDRDNNHPLVTENFAGANPV